MKNFMLLLLAAFILPAYGFAQKTVNEVTLTYNISIESADDNPALSKSMDGATFKIYLKGSDSRSDMQSSLGTESNVYNSKLGKGFILKEYSGQKLMITLNKDNWSQKNQLFQHLTFNLDNTEQVIAGFKAKKATATLESGKTIPVYYSSEFSTSNKDYNNAFRNLPGIPVQYELESGKLKFKYTLVNINYDVIPASKFESPKAGFRVMTYDENQQLKKG